MRRVVVGVDGSESSARALERALLEAAAREASVTVLHAWVPPVWVGAALGQVYSYDAMAVEVSSAQEAEHQARELLDRALLAAPDVVAELRVEEGQPGPLLVQAARGADLLVVGTHERNALVDRLFGRATTYAAHHAPCPVLLVPTDGPPAGRYARVVVGVDGSPQSRTALHWARGIAQREGCPLLAVHVHAFEHLPRDVEPELAEARTWLDRLVRHELEDGTAICQVVGGAPGREVLRLLHPDDLLVLGDRGRGGFAGLHLGSVADQCARHAPCAVAVVRGA